MCHMSRNCQYFQSWVSVGIWRVVLDCIELGDVRKEEEGTLPDLLWPFHFRAWYNFYFDSCNIKLTFHGLLLFLFVFLLAFHIPLSSVEGKRTIFFGVIFSLASIFQLQIFAIPFPSGPIRSLLLPSFSSLHLLCIPPFCCSLSVTQTAGVTLLALLAATPFYLTWFLHGENSLPPGGVSLSFW